jgi:hypothetical protein
MSGSLSALPSVCRTNRAGAGQRCELVVVRRGDLAVGTEGATQHGARLVRKASNCSWRSTPRGRFTWILWNERLDRLRRFIFVHADALDARELRIAAEKLNHAKQAALVKPEPSAAAGEWTAKLVDMLKSGGQEEEVVDVPA